MKTQAIKRPVRRASHVVRRDAAPAKVRTKEARQIPDLNLRVILVPVDFSTSSLQALDLALALAKPFGASVEVLHVLDPLYVPGRFDTPRLGQLRREMLRDAKRRLANVARRKGDGRLRHKVLSGVPYSVIVNDAVHIGASMIVMGSRGRTGLGGFLVGSVAEKVIRHAPCPVLIARNKRR